MVKLLIFSLLFFSSYAHSAVRYYAEKCSNIAASVSTDETAYCKVVNSLVQPVTQCRYLARADISGNNYFFACQYGDDWNTFDTDQDGIPNSTDPEPYNPDSDPTDPVDPDPTDPDPVDPDPTDPDPTDPDPVDPDPNPAYDDSSYEYYYQQLQQVPIVEALGLDTLMQFDTPVCPTISLNLSFVGVTNNFSSSAHCDLFDNIKDTLATFMLVAWTLVGVRILFSA